MTRWLVLKAITKEVFFFALVTAIGLLTAFSLELRPNIYAHLDVESQFRLVQFYTVGAFLLFASATLALIVLICIVLARGSLSKVSPFTLVNCLVMLITATILVVLALAPFQWVASG